MADVLEALLAHRPERVMVVVAAEGEPDRPWDRDVVPGALHLDRVGLLDGEVAAVRRVIARLPGADRPVVAELAVVIDLRPVRGRIRDGDNGRPDGERLAQRVRAVHARRGLHAVEVSGEADRGARWPVVAGAEGQGLVAVPVPRANHRVRGGQLQRPLDGCLVGDWLAEGEPDWHADPVGLVVALEDPGLE